MSNPKEANYRIVRYNGEYMIEVLDKPIGHWYIVASHVKELWQAVELCNRYETFELEDDPGIIGKDYIPVDWVERLEEYGKWKIVRTDEPACDVSETSELGQDLTLYEYSYGDLQQGIFEKLSFGNFEAFVVKMLRKYVGKPKLTAEDIERIFDIEANVIHEITYDDNGLPNIGEEDYYKEILKRYNNEK